MENDDETTLSLEVIVERLRMLAEQARELAREVTEFTEDALPAQQSAS